MTLPNLRKEDRRIVGVAFLILLFLMMSHALLETARDALFLGELLPWAYLAIAVLAVIELRFINKLLVRTKDRRRLLSVSMAITSVITLGFWFWIRSHTSSGVLSFYVWTGLLVTVILVQLWLLVGDSVTVTQAKRVFAPIAAGGVTGAVLGSFVADSLLRIVPTATLILISSAIMLLGAALPMLLPIAKKSADPAEEEPAGTRQRDGLKALFATQYLRQLFLLVLVGTVALTGIDFIFKSIVAQEVASNELGSFFARFYLTINVLSLGVQLFVSSRILQAFGVHRSIGILPILLLLSVVGVAFFPSWRRLF